MRSMRVRGGAAFALALLGTLLAAGVAAPADQPQINWVRGPKTVDLGGQAALGLTERYVFANANDTRKLMEVMGNTVSNTEVGLVAPEGEGPGLDHGVRVPPGGLRQGRRQGQDRQGRASSPGSAKGPKKPTRSARRRASPGSTSPAGTRSRTTTRRPTTSSGPSWPRTTPAPRSSTTTCGCSGAGATCR